MSSDPGRPAATTTSLAGDPMVAPAALSAAVGGVRGLVESALPATVFLIGFLLSHEVRRPVMAAVAVAAVGVALRLLQRSTPKHAAGGVFGILIGAFIASRTHHTQDVYLPGMIFTGGFAVLFLVSLAARWPILGLGFGPLLAPDSPTAWRKDRAMLRAFTLATWLWTAGYVLKLAVMVPLYLAGQTGALGVAKLALGYPLYALTLWLSWRILTAERADHDRAVDAEPVAQAGPASEVS